MIMNIFAIIGVIAVLFGLIILADFIGAQISIRRNLKMLDKMSNKLDDIRNDLERAFGKKEI